VVYLVSAKVDHFSENGLLFSMVARGKMGIDYTAKNISEVICCKSHVQVFPFTVIPYWSTLVQYS
jgi:hypothetical protein